MDRMLAEWKHWSLDSSHKKNTSRSAWASAYAESATWTQTLNSRKQSSRKQLGKVMLSKELGSKARPKVKVCRLLGRKTPSKLWLNLWPKVKVCKQVGKVTPDKLWLKE
ncbi:unnamed protein product [Durusdinium trenchii]|uniref:Uncharacterized protein n=1 Tax=Durusdinium trenchii TaxID=1381693 RepID=A0ABP0P365_9DINO